MQPEKVIIPSTVKPAKEAEKVHEVGVQEASHVYVRHIPRPILRVGAGEEESVAGDRCHADMGLS